jgi:hypothetical protein
MGNLAGQALVPATGKAAIEDHDCVQSRDH